MKYSFIHMEESRPMDNCPFLCLDSMKNGQPYTTWLEPTRGNRLRGDTWQGYLFWLLLASLCSIFTPGIGQDPFWNESLRATGVDLSPWGHLLKYPWSCDPRQRIGPGTHEKNRSRDRLKSLWHYDLFPDRTTRGFFHNQLLHRDKDIISGFMLAFGGGVYFLWPDLTWPEEFWFLWVALGEKKGWEARGHGEARESPSRLCQCPSV